MNSLQEVSESDRVFIDSACQTSSDPHNVKQLLQEHMETMDVLERIRQQERSRLQGKLNAKLAQASKTFTLSDSTLGV